MYVPTSFRQTDPQTLAEFIGQHSFATLVSRCNGDLFATHLPLLYETEDGRHGNLLGHVARANPQWRELAGQEVLAIFSGPHAYVSPTWYGAANMVPTWNYQAVHVYGQCELVEDETALVQLLRRTAGKYEQNLPEPWSFAPQDPLVARLLQGIVGFRITISRIEGKWKLGQNHSAEVRQNAAARLSSSEDPQSRAIAALMAAIL